MQHIRLDVEFRSSLKLMGIYLNLPIIKNPITVILWLLLERGLKSTRLLNARHTCVLEVNSLKFLWARDVQLF